MTDRLYRVDTWKSADQKSRLVRGSSASQVLKHVTEGMYTIEAAGADDVAELMAAGIKVEKVSEA